LQEHLPEALRARVEERVFLESDSGWNRKVVPDVRIVQRDSHEQGESSPQSEEEGGVAIAEPLIIPCEALTEGFIKIIDTRSGNHVVTVIEVLSPANKSGGNGMREYLQKQQEILSSDTNLVEIDLLRAGRRVTSVALDDLPPTHRTPYHVCVRRAENVRFEFYRVPLRERLPIIRIPLRPTDQDITLDLQALVNQAYRLGRYDDIDYRNEPEPALDAEDAKWADALLRKQGLR